MISLALPLVLPGSKGFGTYGRVQRFLNGHYEELLPEFLVLAVWLAAAASFAS